MPGTVLSVEGTGKSEIVGQETYSGWRWKQPTMAAQVVSNFTDVSRLLGCIEDSQGDE